MLGLRDLEERDNHTHCTTKDLTIGFDYIPPTKTTRTQAKTTMYKWDKKEYDSDQRGPNCTIMNTKQGQRPVKMYYIEIQEIPTNEQY